MGYKHINKHLTETVEIWERINPPKIFWEYQEEKEDWIRKTNEELREIFRGPRYYSAKDDLGFYR